MSYSQPTAIGYPVISVAFAPGTTANTSKAITNHYRRKITPDYILKAVRKWMCPSASLTKNYREIVGFALVERLQSLGGFVLTAAVSKTHVHMQVKLPASEARNWIGFAKKHAWFEMSTAGWKDKLWAKRGKTQPIHNQSHHRNCFAYILRHIHEGAWVWVNQCVMDSVIERIIRSK